MKHVKQNITNDTKSTTKYNLSYPIKIRNIKKNFTWTQVLNSALREISLNKDIATNLLRLINSDDTNNVVEDMMISSKQYINIELAPHSCYIGEITKECISLSSIALCMGANPTNIDVEGNTPLFTALQRSNSIALIECLLKKSNIKDIENFRCKNISGRYRYHSYVDIALLLYYPHYIIEKLISYYSIPTKWSCFLFYDMALQCLQCLQCYPKNTLKQYEEEIEEQEEEYILSKRRKKQNNIKKSCWKCTLQPTMCPIHQKHHSLCSHTWIPQKTSEILNTKKIINKIYTDRCPLYQCGFSISNDINTIICNSTNNLDISSSPTIQYPILPITYTSTINKNITSTSILSLQDILQYNDKIWLELLLGTYYIKNCIAIIPSKSLVDPFIISPIDKICNSPNNNPTNNNKHYLHITPNILTILHKKFWRFLQQVWDIEDPITSPDIYTSFNSLCNFNTSLSNTNNTKYHKQIQILIQNYTLVISTNNNNIKEEKDKNTQPIHPFIINTSRPNIIVDIPTKIDELQNILLHGGKNLQINTTFDGIVCKPIIFNEYLHLLKNTLNGYKLDIPVIDDIKELPPSSSIPLIYSIKNKLPIPIIATLLQFGADPNIIDLEVELNSLEYAIITLNGEYGSSIIHLLLTIGQSNPWRWNYNMHFGPMQAVLQSDIFVSTAFLTTLKNSIINNILPGTTTMPLNALKNNIINNSKLYKNIPVTALKTLKNNIISPSSFITENNMITILTNYNIKNYLIKVYGFIYMNTNYDIFLDKSIECNSTIKKIFNDINTILSDTIYTDSIIQNSFIKYITIYEKLKKNNNKNSTPYYDNNKLKKNYKIIDLKIMVNNTSNTIPYSSYIMLNIQGKEYEYTCMCKGYKQKYHYIDEFYENHTYKKKVAIYEEYSLAHIATAPSCLYRLFLQIIEIYIKTL